MVKIKQRNYSAWFWGKIFRQTCWLSYPFHSISKEAKHWDLQQLQHSLQLRIRAARRQKIADAIHKDRANLSRPSAKESSSPRPAPFLPVLKLSRKNHFHDHFLTKTGISCINVGLPESKLTPKQRKLTPNRILLPRNEAGIWDERVGPSAGRRELNQQLAINLIASDLTPRRAARFSEYQEKPRP